MKKLVLKYGLNFIVFVSVILLSNCAEKKQSEESYTPPKETKDSVVISYRGIDSLTVLEILEEEHKVNKVNSAMGTFVKGIDDIENNRSTFWFFSVNGEMAKEAADNIITVESDSIVWYFRQIGVETTEETETTEDTTSL